MKMTLLKVKLMFAKATLADIKHARKQIDAEERAALRELFAINNAIHDLKFKKPTVFK